MGVTHKLTHTKPAKMIWTSTKNTGHKTPKGSMEMDTTNRLVFTWNYQN